MIRLQLIDRSLSQEIIFVARHLYAKPLNLVYEFSCLHVTFDVIESENILAEHFSLSLTNSTRGKGARSNPQ